MKRAGRQVGLRQGLDALARKMDPTRGEALKQVAVATAWESVAGERVTTHTTGAHLRDGELVISVDSPVWATELSAMAGPYAAAINEELGKEAVRSVRFTVSKRVAQARAIEAEEAVDETGDDDEVRPVPLTAAEKEQVEESVSVIEDEELREAALRVTVADLEWKKGLAAAKERERASGGL